MILSALKYIVATLRQKSLRLFVSTITSDQDMSEDEIQTILNDFRAYTSGIERLCVEYKHGYQDYIENKIILERAMSGSYLPNIIAACGKEQPIDIKSKALPSLQLLTRKENNKAALLEAGALGVLVDALKCTDPEMKEVTQRYVAVAICDLIQGSDLNKYSILELGVLDPIKRILTSDEIRNNELKYWTLMILYQISLSDPLPKALIENGFVSLLARMVRMTYGNTNMPKFYMQSLVRIAANVEVPEAKKVLTELLDYNIVDLISNCLRGDDVELIYWAAGLMHEFVLKDVAADKFRKIKGIHVILAGLLSAEEMYISRVILRTIKFMVYGQDKFRHEMIRSGMVKKIMHCLSLDDEDVRYWAILCIHVVAGQVESHEDIISAPEFETLLELSLSTKIKVAIFVSDILSLICCIGSNNTFMEPNLNLIVKTLNTLLIEGGLDVQYNAAGAIFNVITMAYAFASKVRDTCFETLVLMATSAAHERVQLTCTKGALMVVIKHRFLIPQLNEQVTEPLIETVNTLSTSKHEPRTKKIKFNINDAMNANLIEDSEDILEPSATTTDILGEEETDDGEMDRLLRTISNASRLDRVLKDRERTKYKKSKKSNIELIDALTHDDIAYLFDFNISSTERESLLSKFEVLVLARNQITGALTALNILLENDQVIGNIITGESFKAPILDVLDDIVIDIDDIDSKIYNRRGIKNKHSESSTGTKSSIIASILSSEAADSRLPESIQKLLKSLVHLTLYPALEEWANSHYYDYPSDTLTESRATEIYTNVIDWICTFAEPPKYKRENIHSPDSSEDEDRSTGSSDDFGLAKYRHGKDMPSFKSTMSHMKGYGVRSLHRSNYRGHHSDYSSDSENDDSSSDDGALLSVYPKRSKKIESAAERMGETRRKGENFDLDDMLSVSYASEYYLGFSNRALVLLSSLSRYASVRQYLIQDIRFIPVLVYLFEDYNNLTDDVVACLGSLFAKDPFVAIPETSFQVVVILLWRGIRMSSLNRKQSYLFYSRLVLSYCSRFVAPDVKNSAVVNNPSFTEIDLVFRSKYCIINHESFLQVRNDTWTFESVRANRCVPSNFDREDNEDEEESTSRKYAFEVKLESDGLMQIGWVNDLFEFDAEGGNGVGDDTNSYGYDGCRYPSMRTSYGLKWAEGDIITCTIDMDLGELSNYKNGQYMGVAFYGISISCVWYPAISLSTGQQCKFQFGEGCTPVGVLSNKKPIELPPLRITIPVNANSDENDITDLANALEKMSVHSPIYPSDNDDSIEPSLQSVNETLSIKSSLKHTPEPRNQKSPEYAFSVTIPNSQKQNILPSLYFEVAIEFLHKDDDLYLFESVITFGLKSLSPGGSLHFAYDRYKKTCSLFIGSNRSEPISLEICEGDKLGILYIDETNTIGLTYNGVVKGLIYLDKNIKTIPYLPFVTGYMRNEINYGEEPLAWKSADSVSSKQHISNYLDKILGDRTTLKRF
ncbi:hypothetical protein BDF21DRAFT_410072 [Thamnidium elegans]|nr:hypothetical protein BDF21DRAFT_410072 [Thamnidium elegans]